jgi:toxin-antitoxin system PIN domain toxin
MTYLLDVNALLALGYTAHEHHERAEAWLLDRRQQVGFSLATCALTELGFVRVAAGPAAYAVDLETAKAALIQLKTNPRVKFVFLNDDLGVERLPEWVRKPSQTTDGHLMALASAHGAKLATFDTAIPGAELMA